VAKIKGKPLLIVPVPLLTPSLSSRWLSLVTDVNTQAGRSLVDSMANEVVVRDDGITSIVPFEPMGYDEAGAHGPSRARGAEALLRTTPPSTTSGWRRARHLLESRLPMPITHVAVVHPESADTVTRRRRVIAGTSLLGTGLLGLSLATKPGSKEFYGPHSGGGGHLDRRRAALRAAASGLDREP
jgi:hypothetical protein